MRILISTSQPNLVGGIERYIECLIPALEQAGHDIALLYENPADPAAKTIFSSSNDVTAWCYQTRSHADNMAVISDWRPDLVYSQGLEDADLEAALLDKYPTVLYAHNYYGTCISGAKCHTFPDARPCTRRFSEACLLFYYTRRCGGRSPFTLIEMRRKQTAIFRRLNRYSAILVASRHMYREFLEHGVSASRLVCAPLPNPEKPLAIRPDERTPQGHLLFVGRMTHVKGPVYALQAAGKASAQLRRRLKITFAGDGAERAKVTSMARKLDIDVEFPGWVNDTQRRSLIRTADLLVVPSVWPEPFGLMGIEAGALGLPAAAFAVGGIPDWLIPGVSGELAPGDPPTVEGLAAAIVRAIEDPAYYNRLRLGAWTTARSFTLQAHIEKLQQACLSCIEETGNRRPFGDLETNVPVS